MNDPFQLVTNCTFKGKDYLIQMCVFNSKKLELTITDKLMGEYWQCECDASYIEALTHKTGNFKQFDVFVSMLKSGLLKTSECISLDLLTIEDLEQLRCKKIVNSQSSSRMGQAVHLNKRYLIITYSVEFDIIRYPLPLDYCGPPDPTILQSNIRKLESEIERLKQKNMEFVKNETGENAKKLKEKIQALVDDNNFLTREVHRLNKLLAKRSKPSSSNYALQNSLKKLEEQVYYEKNHNQRIVFKLQAENKSLKKQIEELKKSERCLKMKLTDASRYATQRGCRRPLRNNISPENSLERQRNISRERIKAPLSTLSGSWNSASMSKPSEIKVLKKSQNKFLSSSSSESEEEKLQRPCSRGCKQLSSHKKLLCPKRSESVRKSSSDRSKHSSEDTKRSHQSQKLKVSDEPKRFSSREDKSSFSNGPKSGVCSRESSLSSRSSSKHSRVSQFSNLGSGDHKKSQPTSKSIFTKEDLKFSMSDLEARIHSLQKLLSDGIKF